MQECCPEASLASWEGGLAGLLAGRLRIPIGFPPELPEPVGGGLRLFQMGGVAGVAEGIGAGVGEAGGEFGCLFPELWILLSGEDQDGKVQAREERRGRREGALAVVGEGEGPALRVGLFLAVAAGPQGGGIVGTEGLQDRLGVPGAEKLGERCGAEPLAPGRVGPAALGPGRGVEQLRTDPEKGGGSEAVRRAAEEVEEKASAEGVTHRVEARGKGG